MRRVVAAGLMVLFLSGCLRSIPDGTGDDVEASVTEDGAFQFSAAGPGGTGFIVFVPLESPREGEFNWSAMTQLISDGQPGMTVYHWEWEFITESSSDRFFTPEPGTLKTEDSGSFRVIQSTEGHASIGGSPLAGIAYGFASPAPWQVELEAAMAEDHFRDEVLYIPIEDLQLHERPFDASSGTSQGSADFDLDGDGWTLVYLHRTSTYPGRAYQYTVEYPNDYTCTDANLEEGIRLPPDATPKTDWFAHFDDHEGTLHFQADEAGLDALDSIQVARLAFPPDAPAFTPFPAHAESFISPAGRATTCPD